MPRGTYARRSTEELFWAKVEKSEGCWNWTASTDEGYGVFHDNRRKLSAHRWSWLHHGGVIPDGFQLDHLCRNRRCVRPSHLEAVLPRDNTHRSPVAVAAVNARKTVCSRGHPLSGDNLYEYPGRKKRDCRSCWQMRAEAHGKHAVSLHHVIEGWAE